MLRFALVGCGRIAHRHAQLLAEKHVPGAELGAVCDVVPERAAEFGKKYGASHFVDMDEMVAATKPDVISVLTPSGLHAEHVIRLARHGKPMVCEKPMALTLDDADAMIRACDKARAKLVLSGGDPFDEVAFAAGDDHGGGAWDEETVEADLSGDLSDLRPAPVGAGR